MRLSRTVAAVGLLAAAVVVMPSTGIGHAQEPSAQEPSELCDAANEPSGVGPLYGSSAFEAQGFAGETFIASAGLPTSVGTPTTTTMTINNAVVSAGGFPATVAFTLPADGVYRIEWAVNGGNATWNVVCVPAAPLCTITGTAAGDVLIGTDGADVICGLGGGDVIDGRGGNDVVLGGAGGDSIRGGTGGDLLRGEAGGDRIDGRDGAPVDALFGDDGGDSLVGDPGDSLTQ